MGEVILALDLSLASTGYSVLKVNGHKVEVLKVGHINNKKHSKKSHGFRLYQIFVVLKGIIEEYQPTLIVKERGFSKGHKSTQALFKVAGVVDLLAHGKGFAEIDEIAPLTVKACVGGHGKASKEEVERGLNNYLVTMPDFMNDDESDSVAVGVAWLLKNKKL